MTENEIPKWRRAFMRDPDETYETRQAAAEYETAKYGEPIKRLFAKALAERLADQFK